MNVPLTTEFSSNLFFLYKILLTLRGWMNIFFGRFCVSISTQGPEQFHKGPISSLGQTFMQTLKWLRVLKLPGLQFVYWCTDLSNPACWWWGLHRGLASPTSRVEPFFAFCITGSVPSWCPISLGETGFSPKPGFSLSASAEWPTSQMLWPETGFCVPGYLSVMSIFTWNAFHCVSFENAQTSF